ncbi:hypothetical protein BVC80_9045g9 [Macleaya cordata]|uniref:START-like domain n=1 Tax=Macleaya cordata TaxID=56857 RepID=A0A200R334_MACCD|nr:hypothetical protein BVC80_9045g9 [Macleaya cordata]
MATRRPKISEFREKLDRTLACQELVNEESIKMLVKRQISLSSQSDLHETNENVLGKRSMEVKNFLDMMRSASGDHHNKLHGDWKVKEDNDEYRVMYREGPPGTPFHILLVEGYADAPMDVCLCAAWETTLYKKWWPQITIPTFKILADNCLQKIRIGEHLSLVRMKVTWPLSAREVIVHYFELEYLEEDLIIGLLTTVPDIDNVKKHTHGFSNEGIPKAKDIVRMDFIGGTAMKKLSQNKTYFRTIGSMDIKLDFVPTWLINFIARQLMGGACKLYKKTVASVAKGDEDFEEALKDPLYVRIREGLNSGKNLKNNSELKVSESGKSAILSEQYAIEEEEEEIEPDSDSEGKEKEEIEPESDLERNENLMDHSTTAQAIEQCHGNGSNENKFSISPDVQEALGMLDNVIEMVQKGEIGNQTGFGFECVSQEVLNLEQIVAKVGSTSSTNGALEMDNISKCLDEAKNDSDAHNSRFARPANPSREVYGNQIAPASPLQGTVILTNNQNVALISSQEYEEVGVKVNATNEGNVNGGKEKLGQKKKWRYSCLHFSSNLT